MTRLEKSIAILDASIGGPQENIGVHGAFWRGVTRDEFVALRVRNLDLVVLGDGAGSNLIKALKGEAPFGADLPEPPLGARFSRMPAGFPPVVAEDIAFLQQWIDDGCLEDPLPLVTSALVWRPTNAPVATQRTDDIWFTDPQTGWAANSDGTITHTRDGGDTWTPQLEDEEVYFRCLGFANAQRGWCGAVTAGKRLFETRDGGANWSLVPNLPPLAPPLICGLSVVSAQVVYASGTNRPDRPARMMKTVDGGATWSAWDMRPWADILVDCFFTSPTRGWVVGGKSNAATPTRANVKAVVLLTEDGGQTWTNRAVSIEAQLPLGEWGWKIQFLDERIGFVSLENFDAGAILKTMDGGATWTRLPVNDPQRNANLEGVGFVDENHGWVGGWGDRLFQRQSSSETFDGGATWRDANEIGKAINRFRFFGNPVTVGYASGVTVYKYAPVPADEFRAAAIRAPASGRKVREALIRRTASDEGIFLPVFREQFRGEITVRIWERFGELVRTLKVSPQSANETKSVAWDLRNDRGERLPAGHYIIRTTADGMSESDILLLENPVQPVAPSVL